MNGKKLLKRRHCQIKKNKLCRNIADYTILKSELYVLIILTGPYKHPSSSLFSSIWLATFAILTLKSPKFARLETFPDDTGVEGSAEADGRGHTAG